MQYKGHEVPPNVHIVRDLPEEELKRLQNECMFHLQPSGTEGFGHTLRESLSVNSILVTTGVPPMSEIESAYFVPPVGGYQFHQATIHEVSPLSIHEAAKALLSLKERDFPAWDTRKIFLKGNEEFKANFTELLAEFKPDAPKIVYSRKREWEGQKRVAFLGNFIPLFSTENDLAWTFEHLGHEVIRLQENTVTGTEMHQALLCCDMFFWVHTHAYNSLSDEVMEEFLYSLKLHGPSVSFHLDKHWGIPEREERIGKTPFWLTDFVFTADGGFQKQFAERHVNHIWMPPGIVERDCHYGTPREEYKCDVAFVGSVDGYHECYPFRREMVEFLKERYRQRFKTFLHVRGPALNDLYASVKVVVGDSIFAGNPNYWSDRLPETCGRGGFIIFPSCEGLDIPVCWYKAQDLESLAGAIECWLPDSKSRRELTRLCHEDVRRNHTYTQRIQKILKTVFP